MRIRGRHVRLVIALVVGLVAAFGFVTAGPHVRPLHHLERTVGISVRHAAVDLGHSGHHAVVRVRPHMPVNAAQWAMSPGLLALTLSALAVVFLGVVRRSRTATARATIRAPPVSHR
jgi:hypothetical protein